MDDGRTLELSGIPPADGGDTAILVVHDQTQKEQNERVQREFATNVAHELRTPLASIATAVEMLQTGAKDDPEARDDFLELIAREAARLTRLTRALLVLARADAGEEVPHRWPIRSRPSSSRWRHHSVRGRAWTSASIAHQARPRGGGGVSPRILVVDDEPSLVQGLRYALEREKLEVEVVTDGRAAVDTALRRRSTSSSST
jgi:signal transduction histidine kinase